VVVPPEGPSPPKSSLSVTGMLVGPLSSGMVVESSTASGRSLTGVTSRVTVAVSQSPLESQIVYWKLSGPL
jgi:hypothetical protein